MEMLTLEACETVVLEIKGDYWTAGLMSKQITGVFQVTTKRFAFRAKTILGVAKENSFEIDRAEIEKVAKCSVGAFIKFMPTGVKVTMKDGTKYTASVLGRGKLIEALQ